MVVMNSSMVGSFVSVVIILVIDCIKVVLRKKVRLIVVSVLLVIGVLIDCWVIVNSSGCVEVRMLISMNSVRL